MLEGPPFWSFALLLCMILMLLMAGDWGRETERKLESDEQQQSPMRNFRPILSLLPSRNRTVESVGSGTESVVGHLDALC
jgi:hypothetical protein